MAWSRSGGGREAIEPFLRDPTVSEIMVNGPGPVWIERRGQLEATGTNLDAETIELLIEQTVAPLGRRIDRSSPMVDARLPDGSRLNAVVPPVAVDGPYVTIRRFSVRPVPLDDFAPPGVVCALRWSVAARCNLVVSGGAGAGKTTLLNALAASISPGERVVTVEDAAELALGSGPGVRPEGGACRHRRRGPGHHPPTGAQRPADEARPHHRRRGPGSRDPRHAPGHEHRP